MRQAIDGGPGHGLRAVAMSVVLSVAVSCAPASAPSAPAPSGSTAAPAPASGPVKVGAVFALTGPTGALGQTSREGVKLAEERLNELGGIGGRRIEVPVCDSRGEEAQAVTCARQLIQDERVVALIGAFGTPESLAIAPITAEAEVPQLAIAAGIILVQPVRKWLFRTAPGSEDQLDFLANYFQERHITRIAMLNDSNAFGQDGTRYFTELAQRYGFQIVGSETYATADTDMSTQLARLRAANPQVVLNWGTAQGAGVIAKNMQQLGMLGSVPLISSLATVNPAFLQVAGDAASSAKLVGLKLFVANDLPDDDPLKPVATEFVRRYTARYGKDPDGIAPLTYDALHIVADAARRAGPAADQPTALRDQIEQTRGLVGATTTWSYSPADHAGSYGVGLVMVNYRAGKWVKAD
jgi:branched-chain amino acid transport system substrate-binding protein